MTRSTAPIFMDSRPVLLLLAAIVGFGIFLRLYHGDTFMYDMWADRDILRSINLGSDWQVLGPEMGSTVGLRTPGGFYHYLLWPLLQISGSPVFLHYVLIAMDVATILIIYGLGAGYLGRGAGLLAAALYATSPAVLDQIVYLYNPSFSLLFITAATALLLRFLVDGRSASLPWGVLLIALACQIHLSHIALLVGLALAVIVLRPRCTLTHALLAVAMVPLAFSPWLISEAMHGFPLLTTLLTPKVVGQSGVNNLPIWVPGVVVQLLQVLAHYDHWPRQALPGGFVGYGIISLLTNATLPLGLVGGLVLTAGAFRGDGDSRSRRFVLALFLLLTASIGLYVATSVDIYARRILFLISPAILLLAAAMNALAAAAARRGYRAVAVAVLVLALANMVASGAKWLDRNLDVHPNYRDRLAMLAALRNGIGLTDDALRTSLAELRRTENGWVLWPANEDTAIEYLLQWMPNQPADPWQACGLVIDAGQGSTLTEAEARTVLAENAKLLPLPITPVRLEARGRFAVIGYDRVEGNCLRSFANRFNSTPQEKLALEAGRTLEIGRVRVLEAAPGRAVVVARVAVGFGTILMEVTAQGGRLEAVLHGPSIRGGAGIREEWLFNPLVEAVPAGGGAAIRVPFGALELGHGTTLTPWRTAVSLPPGRYILRLVASGYSDYIGAVQPVDLTLMDDFIVQ